MGPWPSKDRAAGFGVMQYIRCVGWLIGWLVDELDNGWIDGWSNQQVVGSKPTGPTRI